MSAFCQFGSCSAVAVFQCTCPQYLCSLHFIPHTEAQSCTLRPLQQNPENKTESLKTLDDFLNFKKGEIITMANKLISQITEEVKTAFTTLDKCKAIIAKNNAYHDNTELGKLVISLKNTNFSERNLSKALKHIKKSLSIEEKTKQEYKNFLLDLQTSIQPISPLSSILISNLSDILSQSQKEKTESEVLADILKKATSLKQTPKNEEKSLKGKKFQDHAEPLHSRTKTTLDDLHEKPDFSSKNLTNKSKENTIKLEQAMKKAHLQIESLQKENKDLEKKFHEAEKHQKLLEKQLNEEKKAKRNSDYSFKGQLTLTDLDRSQESLTERIMRPSTPRVIMKKGTQPPEDISKILDRTSTKKEESGKNSVKVSDDGKKDFMKKPDLRKDISKTPEKPRKAGEAESKPLGVPRKSLDSRRKGTIKSSKSFDISSIMEGKDKNTIEKNIKNDGKKQENSKKGNNMSEDFENYMKNQKIDYKNDSAESLSKEVVEVSSDLAEYFNEADKEKVEILKNEEIEEEKTEENTEIEEKIHEENSDEDYPAIFVRTESMEEKSRNANTMQNICNVVAESLIKRAYEEQKKAIENIKPPEENIESFQSPLHFLKRPESIDEMYKFVSNDMYLDQKIDYLSTINLKNFNSSWEIHEIKFTEDKVYAFVCN